MTFDADPYQTADPYTGAPLVLTGNDAIHILHRGMFLPDFIPALGFFMANPEACGTNGVRPRRVPGVPRRAGATVFDLYSLFIAGHYSGDSGGMA